MASMTEVTAMQDNELQILKQTIRLYDRHLDYLNNTNSNLKLKKNFDVSTSADAFIRTVCWLFSVKCHFHHPVQHKLSVTHQNTFYPRDAMLARSLRQQRVRLSGRLSVTCRYCAKTVHFRHKSYYRTVIGNHMQAIEWCHFRWPWMTPDPGFKVTLVLKGECLQSNAYYRHSYYIGR